MPGVSERAWRQVSVTARECLGGQRCPQAGECFSELARERAHEVDVVVTNHAFVAIDTFENRHMLPEHDLLILDEAHEFADRVTSAISDELTEGVVEAASRRVRQAGVAATSAWTTRAPCSPASLADAPEGRFALGLPEDLMAACTALRDAARDVLSAVSAEQPKPGQEGGAAGGARRGLGDPRRRGAARQRLRGPAGAGRRLGVAVPSAGRR